MVDDESLLAAAFDLDRALWAFEEALGNHKWHMPEQIKPEES